MRRIIVGLMGPGEGATPDEITFAYELGKRIAANKWILLTGGRNTGVMEAANRGAKEKKGITLGILPGSSSAGMSEFVDIPVFTGMGSARNNINVLTADIIIGCGIGPGTVSEISLALKAEKQVILVGMDVDNIKFFQQLSPHLVRKASDVTEAIDYIKEMVALEI